MPAPAPQPSRRGVLRAAGLLSLRAAGLLSLRAAGLLGLTAATAGCGLDLGDVRWGEQTPEPPPPPSVEEKARRRAVETAQTLAASVAMAGVARPDLEVLLSAVAAEHDAHLTALRPHVPPSPASPAPTSPAPTSPTQDPASDPLDDLLAAELTGSGEALTDAADLEPGLARLLASVGAARIVHATLLAGAAGQPAPAAPVIGPAPTGSPDVPAAAVEAVEAALDGEYAAVYTYGVVAARLVDGERDRALASWEAHRLLVERLSTWLTDAGFDPPPSAPAYAVGPLATPQDAVALSVTLEEQVAVLDASLVAASTGDLRAAAADLLVQRALAAAAWRGAGAAFPGLPELA